MYDIPYLLSRNTLLIIFEPSILVTDVIHHLYKIYKKVWEARLVEVLDIYVWYVYDFGIYRHSCIRFLYNHRHFIWKRYPIHMIDILSLIYITSLSYLLKL